MYPFLLFGLLLSVTLPLTGQVVINELMASNELTQADATGEFDDWIELYNNDDIEVDLGGYFLSDKADDPMKWMLPFGALIPEGGYLIIWADEDQEQDGLHANFKLAKGGEAVYFSDPTGTVLDSIVFGEQETDMGLARNPNGTGAFVIQEPTFAADNGTTDIFDPADRQALRISPNPANQSVRLDYDSPDSRPATVAIFDMLGRVQLQQAVPNGGTLPVTQLPAGRYYIRVGRIVRPLVILR